ncbi:hypothetical protein [Yoonia sp. I 8.24]|uniref:hypothetical protein n=1 Tax=Yoonia sp. I 8.24 TaxID=1537229 RepID=UPI001EDD8AFC|nr:hypothetical protein [Yoonia sp. I 8.24]MCG3267048.1 hypothetical protein [Yoonia sp. I 8.24]
MSPADWTSEDGAIYTGSAAVANYGTMNWEWIIGNSHQATGMNNLVVPALPNGGTVEFQVFLQSIEPLAERTKYECTCKDNLADWIAEQTAAAEKFRSAYANPEYYDRPDGVAEEHWDAIVYDDVIALMIGQDMTHEEAVKTAVESHFPNGEKVVDSESAGLDTGTLTAAETDTETCVITYTDAHRASCYPGLEHEVTVVHEAVHRRACFARGIVGSHSIADEGQEEAKAYQAEIDFLNNFIEDNCQ